MKKRYIRYYDYRVYAIFYHESNIVYYNLNFSGTIQLIIFK